MGVGQGSARRGARGQRGRGAARPGPRAPPAAPAAHQAHDVGASGPIAAFGAGAAPPPIAGRSYFTGVPRWIFAWISITLDQEFFFILGACHITFEEDNLVLKIGGYRGQKLFNFRQSPTENLALNTTKILQFSKPLLGFSEIADFEVSKGLKMR